MNSNLDVSHRFDMVVESDGAGALDRGYYFSETLETQDKALDTFGTFGSAGTFGGCFGCLGTAGCCC